MSNPQKRLFSGRSLRLTVVFLFCAVSIAYFLVPKTVLVQVTDKEPISFTGHGAMFDQNGVEVAPTIKFIRFAQEWYIANLKKKLNDDQRKEFSNLAPPITRDLSLDEQSQLVLNSVLLDWLIDRVDPKERDRLRGKNNLLKSYLKRKLTDNPDIRAPQSTEPFNVDQKLLERIKNSNQLKISKNTPGAGATDPAQRTVRALFSDPVWSEDRQKSSDGLFWNAAFNVPSSTETPASLFTLTGNGGAAYRTECLAAGVPTPPDFGPGSPWIDEGNIPQNELFIVASRQAKVLSFRSSATSTPAGPDGMCIALPRFLGTTVELDGVICLGQTGNVCFWDNEKNGVATSFPLGSTVSFNTNFGGGTELIGDTMLGGGGFCSDCHAGENPYIIHGAALEGLDSARTSPPIRPALPTFPPDWYNPIVRSGDTQPWPENPGPMNSPASCVGCHGTAASGSFAGRLPHLSPQLPGYCGSVLRAAVGAKPLRNSMGVLVTNPLPTMPQSNPGGLACTPNLPSSNPNFSWSSPAVRPCSAAMTESCDVTPLPAADPLHIACTPELKALLDWCGVPATGDAAVRGDPHITTFNGINYDFQGAGEFVHLRDANGLEIQTRQTPVSSAGGIPPNAYTGLASCVSVITAVAARVGNRRVTFTGGRERNQLDLKIDGKPVQLGKKGIGLGGGARVIRAGAGNNIEIDFPDKTRLIITANWWADQSVWYMNVDVLNTQAREGIMGAINPTSWLPALPDGIPMGPRPVSLAQRYIDLNQKFADAWRVTNTTSLFDYAPGTSTADFTDKTWPPDRPPCIAPGPGRPPSNPIDKKKALELCRPIRDREMRAQCMFDVSVTGEPGFAANYLVTQSLVP